MSDVTPARVNQIFLAHMNAKGMLPMVLDLQRSSGIDLYDKRTGRRLMDFFGFYATSALGMNHPGLTEDEDFMERLMDAAVNKVTNSDVQTVHMGRFLDTFYRVAMPDDFKYVFFISGGALAVENALKAAFDWKVRKNFARGYTKPHGHQVLHLKEAFHGRSGYTLALTNTADMRKTRYFPKFDWPRIRNPKIVWPLEDHLEEVVAAEESALAEAKQHFAERTDDIACVLMETIQGEGGDNHFRPEFFRAIKDLCLENEALLILDEVQSGVGITGNFWAYQGTGVVPDLISFGKKTQVCGVLAGPRMDEVSDHVFVSPSRINSTWGGNLVDMVRFDRTLEVMEADEPGGVRGHGGSTPLQQPAVAVRRVSCGAQCARSRTHVRAGPAGKTLARPGAQALLRRGGHLAGVRRVVDTLPVSAHHHGGAGGRGTGATPARAGRGALRVIVKVAEPVPIGAEGGKTITEHVGRVAGRVPEVSVARMVAPPGWSEPYQQPAFDEVSVVIRGTLRVEHAQGTTDVHAGESVVVTRGERIRYSNPGTDEAEYWAVCAPAFSPETAGRK